MADLPDLAQPSDREPWIAMLTGRIDTSNVEPVVDYKVFGGRPLQRGAPGLMDGPAPQPCCGNAGIAIIATRADGSSRMSVGIWHGQELDMLTTHRERIPTGRVSEYDIFAPVYADTRSLRFMVNGRTAAEVALIEGPAVRVKLLPGEVATVAFQYTRSGQGDRGGFFYSGWIGRDQIFAMGIPGQESGAQPCWYVERIGPMNLPPPLEYTPGDFVIDAGGLTAYFHLDVPYEQWSGKPAPDPPAKQPASP